MSLNPVQIFNAGAEEEKAETARLVSDNYLTEAFYKSVLFNDCVIATFTLKERVYVLRSMINVVDLFSCACVWI